MIADRLEELAKSPRRNLAAALAAADEGEGDDEGEEDEEEEKEDDKEVDLADILALNSGASGSTGLGYRGMLWAQGNTFGPGEAWH